MRSANTLVIDGHECIGIEFLTAHWHGKPSGASFVRKQIQEVPCLGLTRNHSNGCSVAEVLVHVAHWLRCGATTVMLGHASIDHGCGRRSHRYRIVCKTYGLNFQPHLNSRRVRSLLGIEPSSLVTVVERLCCVLCFSINIW